MGSSGVIAQNIASSRYRVRLREDGTAQWTLHPGGQGAPPLVQRWQLPQYGPLNATILQPSTHPNLLPRDLFLTQQHAYILARDTTTNTPELIEVDRTTLTQVRHPNLPPGDAICPFGGMVALGGTTGALHLIDPATGAVSTVGQLANQEIVAMAATGPTDFAYALADGSVRLFSDPSRVLLQTANAINDMIYVDHGEPTVLYFGGGCPNSLGNVMWFPWTIPPAIGEPNYTVEIRGGVPGSPVWFTLGPSATSFGPVALPATMRQVFGSGGSCPLLVAPDALAARAFDLLGEVTFALPIPSSQALAGLELFGQAFTIEMVGQTPAVITSEGIGIFVN